MLHICTFETPIYLQVLSDKNDTDCAFVMRKGVKYRYCYIYKFNK